MSDSMARMLRPQGRFQNPPPKPFDWQQPWAAPAIGGAAAGGMQPGMDSTMPHPAPPAPSAPSGGQYPAQNGGQYPPGNQYQATTMLQPPGQYGPGQYGPVQYAGDQLAQGQFPPGPYGPGGQFGPGPQHGPDGSLLTEAKPPWRVGGLTLPRGPLLPAIVIAALAVIVVTAIVLSSQSTPNTSASSGGSIPGGAGSTPTGSASAASNPAEKKAAVQLSGLLAQSGEDRSNVNTAYGNVAACGKDLGQDAQVFNQAAANRQALLTKLAQLPGRSALSAAMLADLTGGWQASATVDTDLAKWASKAARHCHKGNLKDSNLAAAAPFDSQATNGKQAFAKLWNRLARKDSLSTYQVGDL